MPHDFSRMSAYLFSQINIFAELSTVDTTNDTISTELLKDLENAINRLALKLGHKDEFHFDENILLSKNFSEKVRDFFTDLNRQKNSWNSGPEVTAGTKDFTFHQALAEFYDEISNFLNHNNTELQRGSVNSAASSAPGKPILLKRIIEKNESGDNITRLVKVDRIDLKNKPVICFGGTASFHDNEKVVEGFLKLAEQTLGGEEACKKDNVELYCVTYPPYHRTTFFAKTHAYNANPENYSGEEAQDFCKNFVLPLLQDKNGKLLPIPRLKQVFAKFNFLAYSYGTVFAQEVRNCLYKSLKDGHLADPAIKEILSNCFALHLGPLCRLDINKSGGDFSNVYVLSDTDLSITNKSPNMSLMPSGKRMRPLGDNSVMIRASVPRQGVIMPETYANKEADSTQMASHTRISKNPSGHGTVFYAKPVIGDDIIHNPRYLGFSLPDALDMSAAYRNLDGRFLPPNLPEEYKHLDGRLKPYSLAVMNETSQEKWAAQQNNEDKVR